ncbi:MAG: adenosylcobinamide-GDP ribazoletransferase [Burkholderiales bacterium]|nr:MAG: adenosylcobinamide-GDP ribazoletransferase [Burkholderiales bacterium]
MTRQLRLLLVAIQFYSRIPVTGRLAAWMGWDDAWLGRATRYFPLVGLIVALGQSLVYVAASIVLPHPVAVLLALAAGLLLTGAFHEDGWADFCDGFGGGTDRARTLAIMRDSRIGAYGAIGVVTLLMLRFETLAHVGTDWIVVALLCAAAVSRGCAVLVMASLRYARDEDDAKAKPVAEHVAPVDTVLAVAFAAAPAVVLSLWIGSWTPAAVAASLALLATAVLRRMMATRLGGYTGDCLGAVQQVAEVAFLLGMLVVLDLSPVAELPYDTDESEEEP